VSEIDKSMRDLLEIIRFTEDLSAKIADVSEESALYGVLNAEFSKSPYGSSVMLLTDGNSKLRLAMVVVPGTGTRTVERIAGINLREYKVDLTKSELLSRVALNGETAYAPASEVVESTVPQVLASVLSKIPGVGERMTVLTPLRRNGVVIGVFSMGSVELAKEFAPSVMILARHIASAMQRIDDIAERRRLEAELRRHTEHLEELVQERTRKLQDAERLATLGQLAAAVGHDLRSPLQAMMNDLYLEKEKLEKLPAQDRKVAVEQDFLETIKRIEEQVDYMNSIIFELQDLGRLVNPQLAKTDMLALLEETIANTKVPANVLVSLSFGESPDLPKPMVDAVMMKRVFSNLINNAVQAMPDGGHLSIGVATDENGFSVVFKDDGVGMSKATVERIFQPLFTTKSKGHGLGLTTCKRLVEANGGRIAVESQLGKGTTFTVSMPFSR